MEKYDAGSPVVIEATIYEYTPFGSEALDDPTTVKVSVIYPDGTKAVDAVSMTKHATGKYYYVCQTLSSWAKGRYQIMIVSTDTYNDITIKESAFYLI